MADISAITFGVIGCAVYRRKEARQSAEAGAPVPHPSSPSPLPLPLHSATTYFDVALSRRIDQVTGTLVRLVEGPSQAGSTRTTIRC